MGQVRAFGLRRSDHSQTDPAAQAILRIVRGQQWWTTAVSELHT